MAKQIKKDNKNYYCEECDLVYGEMSWAEKCEDWCEDNNSCNISITQHSIKKIRKDLMQDT